MKQSTDTNQLLKEGQYVFKVSKSPEKRRTAKGNGSYFIWHFDYADNENVKKFRYLMFPNMMQDLLIALGAEQSEKGVFDWDDEEVIGKQFFATVVHVKGNDGKNRESLENICKKPQEKNKEESSVISPNDIAWTE